MGVTAILMLAAAAEPPSPPPEVLPSDWMLAPPAPPPAVAPNCRQAAAAGEIVVCGRRAEDFLPGTPRHAAEFAPDGPYRIQYMFGDGSTLGPDLEAAAMPDGRTSKRILIRFRMPF